MRIEIDKMISLEKIREIEPRLKDKTDAEVEKIRGLLYSLGQLSLETYFDSKEKSKE